MDVLDKIFELTGMKFEDLRPEEREVAMGWVRSLSERDITLDDIKKFIASMRATVENSLAVDTLTKNQDLFLKARLKNLIMLEAFLQGPEKAQKALELYLKKLGGKNAV